MLGKADLGCWTRTSASLDDRQGDMFSPVFGLFELNAVKAIQHLAMLAVLTEDPRRGALLRGYAEACYGKTGIQRERSDLAAYETFMSALRKKLDDIEIEALSAEGARFSEDEAVAAALAA